MYWLHKAHCHLLLGPGICSTSPLRSSRATSQPAGGRNLGAEKTANLGSPFWGQGEGGCSDLPSLQGEVPQPRTGHHVWSQTWWPVAEQWQHSDREEIDVARSNLEETNSRILYQITSDANANNNTEQEIADRNLKNLSFICLQDEAIE